MELLPILQTAAENQAFLEHPDCQANIHMSMEYYTRVGFEPPWIGYYASIDGQLVGAAAYKGAPRNGTVEIAYGTFPAFQHRGVGAEICRQLVRLAQQTDPTVRITARTLPEENYSVRLLRKNNFVCLGTIWDEEDGDVWEWEYQAGSQDKTKTAVEVFDKRASDYQAKYMDVALYHDTLDLFCRSIPAEQAGILELACGPGNVTRYVLNQRPDFKLLGTDLAPNMLRLAQHNNPEAGFQLLDCRAIGTLEQRYDGILCAFCLPYLSREEAVQLIADAAERLNPGGVLYISTMEDDYAQSGWQSSSSGDRIFIHYHQADYLLQALEANGFALLDLQRIQYPAPDGKTTTDLVLIAKKSTK